MFGVWVGKDTFFLICGERQTHEAVEWKNKVRARRRNHDYKHHRKERISAGYLLCFAILYG